MDKDIKARGALRSSFTKRIQQLTSELSKEDYDISEIKGLIELLEKKEGELTILNNRIYSALLNDDVQQDSLEKEQESNDEYDLKFNRLKAKVTALEDEGKFRELKPTVEAEDLDQTEVSSEGSCVRSTARVKRPFKLPQLELKKFSGELREWLPFWSQFKKIDEDPLIDSGDKFQYLIQATIIGTKARDLVESFPATNENYTKVIQYLKDRYGRDDLLVEVYVRDLLGLVLQNMISSKEVSLSSLYDKLECQLRALETLQVTTDRCASMLMPLVESCLPEDVLRAWQRSSLYTMSGPNQDNYVKGEEQNVPSSADNSKYRLERLMKFLRLELENEQKIKLALSGFSVASVSMKRDDREKERRLRQLPSSKKLPTATGLLTTSKIVRCVFCDNAHNSSECVQAMEMSLIERKRILDKKRCCYNCLKVGHQMTSSWNKSNCKSCGRRHHVMFCDNFTKAESGRPKRKQESEKGNEKTITMNIQCNKLVNSTKYRCIVMLQTLLVQLKGEKSERVARVIIDTASQRSYILKNLAAEMGFESIRKEKIKHVLFGGLNTDIVDHDVFSIQLSDVNQSYHCQLEVLDQTVICGKIDPVPTGSWLQELQQYDIQLTDFEDKPIEILIGADVVGMLLTGKRQVLSSGLVAIETKLGWTLIGCVPGTAKSEGAAMMAISMLTKETEISELWALDVLGISDPIGKKKRQELQEEAIEHFLKTVTFDVEGRFLVHLPWLENHPTLPSNYHIALKRLDSTVRKLKLDGFYDDYAAVLEEWVREGIIEEVPEDELQKEAHYLPHRHVVKLHSTTKIRPVFDASAKEKDRPSLNNCLEKGANLIEMIPAILLRFRTERIGVIADIRKAFLQISLSHPDKDFLRFLWYDHHEQLKVYRQTSGIRGLL